MFLIAWLAPSVHIHTLGVHHAHAAQWRNSYGLRVGKPAGTRAERAPAGCPFTQAFQLILLFHKGAPFQHFPTVWLRNSHNDAFHKLIKWQNYLVPFQRVKGGWGSNFTYVCYNTGMCRPNGWILHKKSVNMGFISTPPKIPKRGLNL